MVEYEFVCNNGQTEALLVKINFNFRRLISNLGTEFKTTCLLNK